MSITEKLLFYYLSILFTSFPIIYLSAFIYPIYKLLHQELRTVTRIASQEFAFLPSLNIVAFEEKYILVRRYTRSSSYVARDVFVYEYTKIVM